MDCALYVLSYHRVLPDDGRTENVPYFLRGTAVSQAVFDQHVRDLRSHFDCLDEGRALAVLRGEVELERPACWVTFDDAYADVLGVAAPALEQAAIPATLFVATSVLEGVALPADRWYSVLTTARRRRGTLDDGAVPFDLDEADSLARFIDGPEKRRFLRSSRRGQEEGLVKLAQALDATSTVPDRDLYLDASDVRELVRRGWSVGSHSVSHPLLTDVPQDDLRHELTASRARLTEILAGPPATFAYPDGAWDATVARHVEKAGYEGAVTLVPSAARPDHDLFGIPRLLARNEPDFVRSLLRAEVGR